MRRADWALLAVICLAFLLTAGAGAAWGYMRASSHAAGRISQLNSYAAICTSTSQAQTAAIAKLQDELDARDRQIRAQKHMAEAALKHGDVLQAQLAKKTRQLAAELTKVGHEDPDCADLAHLPVCPSVAERLWPQGKGADPPQGD